MKKLLTIDTRSGHVRDANGATVFDPAVGPPHTRLNDARLLFQGVADGDVKVMVYFVEIDGGYLHFHADHPMFGSQEDWTQEHERARMKWLSECLAACGAPVGSYGWGEVAAVFDARAVQGFVMIRFL